MELLTKCYPLNLSGEFCSRQFMKFGKFCCKVTQIKVEGVFCKQHLPLLSL